MTPRLRVLVGALTSVVFLAVGTSLLVSERWAVGGAVVALGLLRVVVLVRQARALTSPPTDDPGRPRSP